MTIVDRCKHCSYKFKPDDFTAICAVCCGTRDKYANLAHEWGCTRSEAKYRCLAYTYGPSAEVAQKIFTKHGSQPIFNKEEENES